MIMKKNIMKRLFILVNILLFSIVSYAQFTKVISAPHSLETYFLDEKTIVINSYNNLLQQTIKVSTDTGNTWKYINLIKYGKKLFFNNDTAVYIYKSTRKIYRTFDCWKTIDSFDLSFLESNPIGIGIGKNTIFFSSYSGKNGANQKTYRSLDYGETWDTVAKIAITEIQMIDSNLGFGMTVMPSKQPSYYPREFVKTIDGGASWQIIPESFSSFMIHEIDFHKSVIYIGENILMKSEDYGDSWKSAAEDLKKESLWGNAFSFINDSVGFLTGKNKNNNKYNLYRTYNKGESWHLLTEVPRFYRDISTFHKDNFIYILLFDDIENGMFYLKYSDSAIYNSKPKYLGNNQLHLFPNPVKDYLNIISDNNSHIITIEILSLNGRIIKKIAPTNCKPIINTRDLISGIYFVRITSDKGVNIEKIIKV